MKKKGTDNKKETEGGTKSTTLEEKKNRENNLVGSPANPTLVTEDPVSKTIARTSSIYEKSSPRRDKTSSLQRALLLHLF